MIYFKNVNKKNHIVIYYNQIKYNKQNRNYQNGDVNVIQMILLLEWQHKKQECINIKIFKYYLFNINNVI